MCKQIPLTKGFVALIDAADYPKIAAFRWKAQVTPNTVYAVSRVIEGKIQHRIRMHRIILGLTDPRIEVDHKDHNGLNNQRRNLRCATRSNNQGNRRKQLSSSRFKGVYWKKKLSCWVAQIGTNPRKHLGCFSSELKAAKAYAKAAGITFGTFAYTNLRRP